MNNKQKQLKNLYLGRVQRDVCTLHYKSLHTWQNSRVLTEINNYGQTYVIVYGRNPYGCHNLVVVAVNVPGKLYPEAVAHGNYASLSYVPDNKLRRVLPVLPPHVVAEINGGMA